MILLTPDKFDIICASDIDKSEYFHSEDDKSTSSGEDHFHGATLSNKRVLLRACEILRTAMSEYKMPKTAFPSLDGICKTQFEKQVPDILLLFSEWLLGTNVNDSENSEMSVDSFKYHEFLL